MDMNSTPTLGFEDQVQEGRLFKTQHLSWMKDTHDPQPKPEPILPKWVPTDSSLICSSPGLEIQYPDEGYSPGEAINRHSYLLTDIERKEILDYDWIYYLGEWAYKWWEGPNNDGFDDDDDNYIIVRGDHIDFRFELKEALGKGSFGEVAKAFDHKRKW